jgi:hypothetical protein
MAPPHGNKNFVFEFPLALSASLAPLRRYIKLRALASLGLGNVTHPWGRIPVGIHASTSEEQKLQVFAFVPLRPFIPVLAEMFKLMDLSKPQALNFSLTSLHYLIKVGNIVDVEQLIQGIQHFPEPIRGELMTAAEKLQAMGEERGEERGLKKGEEKGREEVAINSLKEGVDPKFVARITGLELAVILKLKAELEEDE